MEPKRTTEVEQALIVTDRQYPSVMMVTDEADKRQSWALAMEAWLASLRLKSGTENTVNAYRLGARQFFQWLGGDVPPWGVSAAIAQDWATWLATEGKELPDGERGPLSDSSLCQKISAVSSFYEYARRREIWPADRINPFSAVDRPKVEQYGRAKFPSSDELTAILGEINTDNLVGKRDFALLFTIAVTCRRSSEVLNLQWGDINEGADGDYWFRYRYKGEREKTRKAVLLRECYVAICEYLKSDGRFEHMEPEDFIFIALYPGRIKRIRPSHETDPSRPIGNSLANRILKKYARRAGVDLDKAHVHALRHAGARLRVELMRARGAVDFEQIQTLLGHKSISTTMIYAGKVLTDPEDPDGHEAAMALMPRGKRRRKRKPAGEQAQLL